MCVNYSEVGSLALVTVTVTVPVPVSVSVAITIGLVSLTDSVGTRKVIIRAFGRISRFLSSSIYFGCVEVRCQR